MFYRYSVDAYGLRSLSTLGRRCSFRRALAACNAAIDEGANVAIAFEGENADSGFVCLTERIGSPLHRTEDVTDAATQYLALAQQAIS